MADVRVNRVRDMIDYCLRFFEGNYTSNMTHWAQTIERYRLPFFIVKNKKRDF